MNIMPKTQEEIAIMIEGGKRLNTILKSVDNFVALGQPLTTIETFIKDQIKEQGAESSFLGHHNYPAVSCLSVNDIVVHGIPNTYILKDGDILGVDIGIRYQGFHTDAAFTKKIGTITLAAEKLLIVTQQALQRGIEAAVAGNKVSDIGKAVEMYVNSQGNYGIIRDLQGHGIGKNLWEQPEIPNFFKASPITLTNGMTLAIEPMISLGTWQIIIDDDDWTIRTKDKSQSAHYEVTLVIHDNDPMILTPFPLQYQVEEAE